MISFFSYSLNSSPLMFVRILFPFLLFFIYSIVASNNSYSTVFSSYFSSLYIIPSLLLLIFKLLSVDNYSFPNFLCAYLTEYEFFSFFYDFMIIYFRSEIRGKMALSFYDFIRSFPYSFGVVSSFGGVNSYPSSRTSFFRLLALFICVSKKDNYFYSSFPSEMSSLNFFLYSSHLWLKKTLVSMS